MTSSFDKPWELKGNEAARHSPSQKLSLSRCYSSHAADAFKAEKIQEALSFYEKAFRVLLPSLIDSETVRRLLTHEETRILLNMATCKYKLGQMQDVTDLCGQIMRHGFEDCLVKASWRRGTIRFQGGDLDGAREDFETCLKNINWEREALRDIETKRANGENVERVRVGKDRLGDLEQQENFKEYNGNVESDPGLEIFAKEVPHVNSTEALNTLEKSCKSYLVKIERQLKEYKFKERAQLAGKLFN